jgi:hypothetical protein
MNKNLFLGLAVIGLVLPYSQFVPFLLENGLNLSLIIHEITAYRLSAFAWLDVVVTAVTVITMIVQDRVTRWWLPVAATLLVGPSCGLPLYLYMRE